MKKLFLLLLGLLVAILGLSSPSLHGQLPARPEPLVEKVKTAITKAKSFLRTTRKDDGSWELTLANFPYPGGQTAIAVLALLNSDVPVADPMLVQGLSWLRKATSDRTYVVALQTMALADAKQPEDLQRIKDNVQWLLDARVIRGGALAGWGYTKGQSESADNSNTQYAVLGLWAGKQAGVSIAPEVWTSIAEFYIRTQDKDGSWVYSKDRARDSVINTNSLTMTSAGLCGLLIAGMESAQGRERLNADGTATGCGVYEENLNIALAKNWLANRFRLELDGRTFYNLYGIERVGRLTGERFIGGHDWYREGCVFLVSSQKPDGSWYTGGPGGTLTPDQYSVVSTSFALLFLSKGRTGVLVSKLVHGNAFPRQINDNDWNNDRNDLKHLVDYAGKQLFKNLPMAWQNFDISAALLRARGNVTDDDLLDVTAELVPSPVLYITGHLSPRLRLSEAEKKVLRYYVENGGFIFAEACCASPGFKAGFEALVKEIWPDHELTKLDGSHPVWSSHFVVAPGDPYELYGLSMGCKTVLIFSPQDLSCQWEANAFEDRTGRGERAFKLGTNIIAYATGSEPPRPRLTPVDVTGGRTQPSRTPRGAIQVVQLKHSGDWQPAPRAMHNLMDHLHKYAGLDVIPKAEERTVYDKNIRDFRFLYMQGRGDFRFESKDLEHLQFNLQHGGLLFADASCGQPAFDGAFRKMCQQLFPDLKLEPVSPEDPLFGKDIGGEVLSDANIRIRTQKGGLIRPMAPALEGVRFHDRWVILYSKYDIGCALEKHQSADCIGYHPDSALKIASAAMLYTLRP